MRLTVYQVDAFSSAAFKGNPAGVCITQEALDAGLMRSIAAEMAVSETAFLSLETMTLRWFTPKVEVNLCGHGTLAVAHILKENAIVAMDETVVFNTLSGALSVTIHKDTIDMDFPAASVNFDVVHNKEILSLLGIKPEQVMAYGRFDVKDFIEVDSEATLLNLTPDFSGLAQIAGRGVVVTTKSANHELDFICRYFAPWVGVNEDPVTGSAHCALAVYWGEKLAKSKLKAYQASARGGFVDMECLPNNRVKLIGSAVTVLKGTLFV